MSLRSFLLAGAILLSSSFFSADATYRDSLPHDEDHTESRIRLVGQHIDLPSVLSMRYAAGAGDVEGILEEMHLKTALNLALKEPLDEEAFGILGAALSKDGELQSLTVTGPLENNSVLDGVKMGHLIKGLGSNHPFKTFGLEGHRLTTDGVSALIDALKANASLAHFLLLDAILSYEDLEKLDDCFAELNKTRPVSADISPLAFDPPTEIWGLDELLPRILKDVWPKENSESNPDAVPHVSIDFETLGDMLKIQNIQLLRMKRVLSEEGDKLIFVVRPMLPSPTADADKKPAE